MFQVTVLGSSSALPTPSRGLSSHLVNVNHKYILIDCGEGTQQQLKRFGIKFQRIDAIFITHLHGDHYFGLIGLLNSMQLYDREKEIHIYGPQLLEKIIRIQVDAAGGKILYPIHFHALEHKSFNTTIYENNALKVSTFPLKHGIPCWGFKVEEQVGPRKLNIHLLEDLEVPVVYYRKLQEGKDVELNDGRIIKSSDVSFAPKPTKAYAYCSDTRYSTKVVEAVKGVDLLYHEATFTKEQQKRAVQTNHSTAEEAGRVAKEAGVKKLIIGHFSARYVTFESFVQEAEHHFAPTILAKDGLVIAID